MIVKCFGNRRGFTLIELLVVIAIIAILAAILFPVFSMAREKARQTTCISNEKQLALGFIQYISDYDGVFPLQSYCTSGTPSEYCSEAADFRTWVSEVGPYISSYDITRCPDETKYSTGEPDFSTPAWTAGVYANPSFAYNADYLNPDPDCSTTAGGESAFTPFGAPIQESVIESSALTVLLTDAKLVGNNTDGWFGSWNVDAPASAGPSAQACTWMNGGWGVGAYGDTQGALADGPPTGTGVFAPRHSQGGDVVFCDGHAKWFTPGGLAAGTNWTPTTLNTDVLITDLSQYLWSLKKSGNDDL